MYSPETAMARYAGHIYSLEHSQRRAYLAISNKQIPVSGTSSYYRLNNKCIDMCQMTGITVDLLWAVQEGGDGEGDANWDTKGPQQTLLSRNEAVRQSAVT